MLASIRSAASVFLFLQAALGLQIDGVRSRISLVRPALPPFLNDIEIINLRVGASIVTFILLGMAIMLAQKYFGVKETWKS